MFVFVLVIGLGLLALGIYNLSERIKLIPKSKVITGTVIDFQETPAKRGKAYYPIIEYRDPETNTMESYKHEVGSKGHSEYHIGDSLELCYYNGRDKKLVLVNTWSGKWSAPIAFIVAGVIFTAFGVFMALVK